MSETQVVTNILKNAYNGTNESIKTTITSESGNSVDVNAEGQLHVVQRGTYDTGNSIESNLSAGEIFTGTSIDTLDFAGIGIQCHSDVQGVLYVQFSPDLIEWRDGERYEIIAGGDKFFTPTMQLQYMRVVYTNGSTITSDFGIHTYLHKSPIKWSSHNINEAIVDEDDAELTKSVLTGKGPDSIYRNVNVTTDGDLSINDNSSGLAISEGNVTNTSFIHKFGYASDFDTGDGEVDIWDGATDGAAYEAMNYTFSTTADIDSMSSSSASDTNVDIEIQGLDSNYLQVTQRVTLIGQTRVPLLTNLIRVFRLKNVGMVDLTGECFCYVNGTLSGGIPTDTSTIRAIISQGTSRSNNQTLMAIYTIPNGKEGYMRDWYSNVAGANKTSNYIVRLYARPFNSVFQLKHISAIGDNGTSAYKHDYTEPARYDEKTDLLMTVEITENNIAGAGFSAGFDLVLKIPDAITGFILQQDGFHLLQETGDRLFR